MTKEDEIDPARDMGAKIGLQLFDDVVAAFGASAPEAAHGIVEALVVGIAHLTSNQDAFNRLYETVRCVQLADRYPQNVTSAEARELGRNLACDVVGHLPEPLRQNLVATVEGLFVGAYGCLAALTTDERAATIAEAAARASRKTIAAQPNHARRN